MSERTPQAIIHAALHDAHDEGQIEEFEIMAAQTWLAEQPRALAAAHAEAARLRLALLPFASQWTETLDAVFREISPQVEVRCDATVAMMRNAAAALAPPPAAPQDK